MANRAKEIQNGEKMEIAISGGILTGLSKVFRTEENFTGNDLHELGVMFQAVIDKTGTAGTPNASVAYTDIVGSGTLTRQFFGTKEKLDDPKARDYGDIGLLHYKREKLAPVVYVVSTATKDVFSCFVEEDFYNINPNVPLGEQGRSFVDDPGKKLEIVAAAHSLSGLYTALPSVIAASSVFRAIIIPKVLQARNPSAAKAGKTFLAGKKLSDMVAPFRQHFMDNPPAETPEQSGRFSLRIDEQRDHPRKDLHIEELLIKCATLSTICADSSYPDNQLLSLVGRRKVGDAAGHKLFEINGFVLRTKLLNAGYIVSDALYLNYGTADGEYGLPVSDPATGHAFAGGLYLEGYNSVNGLYEFYTMQNCLSEQAE